MDDGPERADGKAWTADGRIRAADGEATTYCSWESCRRWWNGLSSWKRCSIEVIHQEKCSARQTRRSAVAVPTTIHCDHLIRARVGAAEDLAQALGESGLIGGQSDARVGVGGADRVALRIVTQAMNAGVLSAGQPGEPPVNLHYLDIPLSIRVGQ